LLTFGLREISAMCRRTNITIWNSRFARFGGLRKNPLRQGKVQSREQSQTSLASRTTSCRLEPTRSIATTRTRNALGSRAANLEDQVGVRQLNTTIRNLPGEGEADTFTKSRDARSLAQKRHSTPSARTTTRARLPTIRIQGVEVREDGSRPHRAAGQSVLSGTMASLEGTR
jgi:hypothetical protein